ncbi:restriction endonuclease subunit S [Methylicorpusculum oleiharenae]|uniref:restriction endonuclease subunit S n=1 Tax=Methylicorpusculum oleiharenae TaxID=1338687 RepID=UPI001E5A3E46|nr:restriction endonuclease subunit S [Methylicorpusculum oleiharenae]MCD2449744.1 restriction endonuclease subunit S [Methylicorpusculum oleiharenae]
MNPSVVGSPRFSKYIQKITTGSLVPHISSRQIKEFYFDLPSLMEQKIIAGVLSTIDAKIELNNRINVELEAIAKTLYDFRFVQFDFPYDFAQGKPASNGKPYKSSGGKMVYNPTLKREIPEGWNATPLSSITNVSNDSLNPADTQEKSFKHFSIPVFDATNTYGVELGETIGNNKFTVEKTDLLVSKLNPWFNRVVLSMANTIEPFSAINFEPLFQRKINYSALISVDSFPLPA